MNVNSTNYASDINKITTESITKNAASAAKTSNAKFDFNDPKPREVASSLESIKRASMSDPSYRVDAKTNLTEKEAYATLVHSKLNALNPKLAEQFIAQLPEALKRRRQIDGDGDLFKATDRILRGMIQDGSLSQDQYRSLKSYALGKSQMDGDRTSLSNSNSTLLDLIKMLSENSIADTDELKAFKRLERNMAPALNKAQKVQGSGAESPPSNTFLWKPSSDKDGKLVVLLPTNMLGKVQGIRILSADGKSVAATGKYTGVGNGMRAHFRFDKPGASFPAGSIVEIQLSNGQSQQIKIDKPAERFEKR